MTDYLTRLAKRTLGLLPVAHPLITPSFSSFTSRMNDRPETSFIEDGTLFDKKVILGTQEKEIPQVSQAYSKPRSKMQNSLLPHNKSGADIRDQTNPETNILNQDVRSIPQPVHVEKQIPSKATGIAAEEKYDEQEIIASSNQAPKYPKNSEPRGNPYMMEPKIEKNLMGSRVENEMNVSITEEEMKDIDIPDPISISMGLSDPFSKKYGIDIFSENHINHKSNLIRQSNLIKSNLNEKPDVNSSGDNLNLDYAGTPDILHKPGKLISSEPSSHRVAWPGQKDRSIVKDKEHNEIYNEINKKTAQNVINPVIKISPEGKNHFIRDIQTKIQQPPIPTIKVTIGRVEVRAVPPPPVLSPSPAMKKPALSLDEYLKQHNG